MFLIVWWNINISYLHFFSKSLDFIPHNLQIIPNDHIYTWRSLHQILGSVLKIWIHFLVLKVSKQVSFWRKDFLLINFGQSFEIEGCPDVLQFTQEGLFVYTDKVSGVVITTVLTELLAFETVNYRFNTFYTMVLCT